MTRKPGAGQLRYQQNKERLAEARGRAPAERFKTGHRSANGSFYSEHCYLAQHGRMEDGSIMPSCDGHLIKAHLIPKQLLIREGHDPADARSWVYACGGIRGNGGHHGMLDSSRTLRVPYEKLPPHLIQFAEEIGLDWWLEREYKR